MRHAALSADKIIGLLDMKRHPEGGWYAETFRDNPKGGRGHSTAIYFLLKAGEVSAWHRVDAAEVWHHYAGAALELTLSQDGSEAIPFRLGIDLAAGERPQVIVPTGWWQAARTTGNWTLIGCTVAPGFDFSGFELAPAGWEPGQ